MEPLYGILYLTLSAVATANWTPPPEPPSAAMVSSLVPAPPAEDIRRPPTAFFRELLGATPSQREQLLALYSPVAQDMLITKVREYDALPRDYCENRLRTLELRWYLAVLMGQSPTNREALLNEIPRNEHSLVQSRLAYWDQLTPHLQDAILENETAIRLQYSLPLFSQTLTNLSPAQQRQIEKEIAHWKSLPDEDRQKIYWCFKFLFELNEPPLPPATKIADVQPPVPQNQFLEKFNRLSASERSECLTKMRQFNQLSQEQRNRFKKAAAYWLNNMSESEREACRLALKRRSNPPLPPRPPTSPVFSPVPPVPARPVSFDATN